MAYTVSGLASTVMGDQRVVSLRITPDAATGVVSVMNNINFFSVAIQSATTGAGKFAMNELAAGTSVAGMLGISGVASGDEYIVTVYGR